MDKESVAHAGLLPGEGPPPEPPPVVARLMADVRVLDWGDDDVPWVRVEILTINKLVNAAHRDGILASVEVTLTGHRDLQVIARIKYDFGTVDVLCRTAAGRFRLEAM